MNTLIQRFTLTLLLVTVTSILFAQRYFPTVDTYIEQSSPTVVENTTNPGKLVLRNIGGSQRISFLEFNIADFSEQVSKAELCLYFYAVTNSGTETVDVYEVTTGTITNDITWTGFTGNYTLASTPITSLDIPSTAIGWCRFEIKTLVNTIAATAGTNKKIKLALKSRTTNLLMSFYSVDQTTYAHYQPFLIMTPAPATDLVEKSRTTVVQDGYVYNSAPDSKYDEQWLYINYYKSGTNKQYRYTNLRFDIPATTLNENNRVTIKTKVYGAQCDANIVYVVDLLGVDNLNDATDVNNLTWNTMPVTGNYTYLRSRFFSLNDKTNETNIEWDVTNYVKAQQMAGKNFVNFSLQIPELGGYIGHNIALYARNYLNTYPSSTNIPQLIVYGSNIPTIISFTPTSAGNGSTVTITGTNLIGVNAVSFGGTAASSFIINSDTQITATVATGSSGSVSVTTSGGTATKTGFTWLEPVTTISSVQNATALPLSASSVISVTNGGLLNIDTNTTVNSITIESGGKVTNSSSLVTSSLFIESNAGGTGTYVDNGSSTITTASVKQYLTNGRNWYISIPVTTSNISAFSFASSLVRYYEPTATWYTQTIDSIISPMKGYISANTNSTGTITFTGTLNTGTKSIELTRTTGVTKEGFNLVGNPYPSYVKWESATKTNLEPTIWFRSKNAGNTSYVFDTYNATSHVGTDLNGTTVTDSIPPMQAFWVRVASGYQTGTLAFDNTMRCHKGVLTNMLKAPAAKNTEQKVLCLQVSNGINSDETIVLFNSNALDVYDDYDSPKMTNANAVIPEIYTLAGTEQLVINGLNSLTDYLELPLGFTTGQSNSFSIKTTQTNNFNPNTKIILKDDQLRTEQDITDGTAYYFNSDAVSTASRFSVIFRTSSFTTAINNNIDNNNSIFVFKNANNQIEVNISSEIIGKASISVFNAVGQKLDNKQLTSAISVLNNSYTSGIYLVNIIADGKTITRKIVVN